MKKLLLAVLTVTCAFGAFAVESADTLTTLNQIIAMETKSKSHYDQNSSLNAIWGKTTFLNISYNKTKFSSKEFPSTTSRFEMEYDNDLGVGLQWGHTFNLHKKPIGSVMFFGLDFTWMDLNFNKYKALSAVPQEWVEGEQVHNLPWHHERMTLGYGMSLGPSLTFYPFTSLNKSGSSKIRLHVYFHVGYGAEGAMIKNVTLGDETKNKYAYGHGLFLGYGASLSWDFIGVGYEFRNDDSLKFKAVDSEFDTGSMKAKEKTSRLYLQFRF